MKLRKPIPQFLPISGCKIRIYYNGIKRECTNCYGHHAKQNCRKKKSGMDWPCEKLYGIWMPTQKSVISGTENGGESSTWTILEGIRGILVCFLCCIISFQQWCYQSVPRWCIKSIRKQTYDWSSSVHGQWYRRWAETMAIGS